jgi:dTDP-4-amino-4,6-dideoxygalactose transaminase
MINVTKTFLPPQEEYNAILKRAWDNNWIANRGELVKELEKKLRLHLSIKNITITNNGTVPLQIAIKALGLTGEIITTPFSYVATTASIVWEKCTPVFVDIHPEYLTIDETRIEEAITSETSAILATHVFGNPCNIEAIESIAERHHLKVIYDAAHSFGVKYKNESVFNFGDISTCSFHATKLFHTGEGGAMFSTDDTLQEKLYYHHNFGHKGPLEFNGLGINAKISELQAAMGLSILPYMKEIIAARKKVVDYYNKKLFNKTSSLAKIKIREHTQWNYSYYPVIFESEEKLLGTLSALNKESVFPRRYFYPSLNTIEYAQGQRMPVSESIVMKILCLPLYHDLSENDQETIIAIINSIVD